MPCKRFQEGEVAILRNQNGGRKFVVLSDNGREVIEYHPIPSQQKYVTPTRSEDLVRVHANQVDAILAKINRVGEDYRFRLQLLEKDRRAALEEILSLASV